MIAENSQPNTPQKFKKKVGFKLKFYYPFGCEFSANYLFNQILKIFFYN